MKKNIKAIGTGTLISIMLVIAALIPISFFTYNALNQQKEQVGMKACQLSILNAANQKKFTSGKVYTPLNCQRNKLGELVIRKKDVVGPDDKINQRAASKIIAETMAECWQMIGEGKRDPFSNWDSEGSYCMICKTIRFDDDLKEYFKESLTDKKVLKKRGEDAFILSPIPYMMQEKNKWRENNQNYFEYIYGVSPREASKIFTKEDIDKMNSTFVDEGTMIMLKLYKFNDKDAIATIATWGAAIVGVVLLVVGVVLTFTGVGAAVGVPLSSGGATLLKIAGVSLAVGSVLLATSGVNLIGVTFFDPVNLNPMSECTECNGIGSIKLVPPTFNLRQEWQVTYPEEITGTDEEIVESGPYCKHLIN